MCSDYFSAAVYSDILAGSVTTPYSSNERPDCDWVHEEVIM